MATPVAPYLNPKGQADPLVVSPPSAPEATNQVKVLIVDDFLIERRVVGRMIQRMPGIAVIEAADGKEALEAIEREAPAIVLTDIQMPQMSGLELVAAVREKFSHIPVILMTAHGSEEFAIQALRAVRGPLCHQEEPGC